jgi:hypothetical protein
MTTPSKCRNAAWWRSVVPLPAPFSETILLARSLLDTHSYRSSSPKVAPRPPCRTGSSSESRRRGAEQPTFLLTDVLCVARHRDSSALRIHPSVFLRLVRTCCIVSTSYPMVSLPFAPLFLLMVVLSCLFIPAPLPPASLNRYTAFSPAPLSSHTDPIASTFISHPLAPRFEHRADSHSQGHAPNGRLRFHQVQA